ncbi:HlyD family secretion protein [Roseiconus lacunae]|uniref:HlyD family efflux transporter periplasmic adaptor subunit n=1 Tax=Roseiconus lacunae TaxID=2605694 RepID=A0ABT7PCR8_9BACT|nr:efflux RND transporter periplasmic adaptor subunit [Roseiconus lacunae]MCD0459597.1 HlyD family secretion protein [Roseiconus lacunae]MDM4014295.1 HlyD family efflux transporter periplasmic adaptor subunit [Roseiconus lacunae]WRQ49613.1 efflux RND transporter periplasmic adaptor subunit [Stieleria sp. HD01]
MLPTIFSADDFPALQMVRTGRYVRIAGRLTFWVLIFSIAAMIFVPWRQTARGTGVVVALDPQQRPQPMLAQAKGVISYVKPGLREGSYVEQGELLLRMTPFAADGVSQVDNQIIALESKEEALKASVEVAKQNETLQNSSGRSLRLALEQEFEAAKQKWEQAKNEVVEVQAELASKENQLQVAERVFPEGLISQEELINKRQAVQAQRAKVLKAENKVQEVYATLSSKEEEIESKKQEISIKNQDAANKVLDAMSKLNTIEKEILDLRNKRQEYDRLSIRAPRSGYIQEWYGRTGSDTIKEGERLFVIVPVADQLAVEMSVNGNDMPLIKENDRVRLQFEGWPAVQFVGWPSVAVGTFGGKVNRVFPTDDGKGNFRVIVVPDNHFERENGWPDSRYLRQGVRATGWVLLRRVPLGYEIWRQLNGFPPVVSDEAPKDSKGGKLKLPKP